MVWLYYTGSTEPIISSAVIENDELPTVFSFKSNVSFYLKFLKSKLKSLEIIFQENQLRLVAAKFDVSGTFLGYEDLSNSGSLQVNILIF